MAENLNIISESINTTYDSATSSATVTILLRRKAKAEWANSNYIPKLGEPCFELDTYGYKIGDGIHSWSNLPYATCAVDDGELV